MSSKPTGENRRIVTCDGCGTPYPAVEEREQLLLVGPEGETCPSCGGTTFSPLEL